MLEKLLYDGISEMGLDPNRKGVAKLLPYLEMMLERNRELNLTSVTEPAEAVKLHLLDSLAIFKFLDLEGKTVIDVGTGGGMPGVAIALYEPEARVTLLDATGKKLAFIKEACNKLGIFPDIVNARAEEYARTGARESYNVVVARAVAAMPTLLELCMPLVKQGGVFAAYKGAAEGEIEVAKKAATVLGGGVITPHSYVIPGADAARTLIITNKKAHTPSVYPRAFAQIKKRPL